MSDKKADNFINKYLNAANWFNYRNDKIEQVKTFFENLNFSNS